ncbi:MAG: hypothetical protein ACAH83_16325 [Alphaproteobacteria bacterium]
MKKIMKKMQDGMYYALALAFIVMVPLAAGAGIFGFLAMAGADTMLALIGGVLAGGFAVSVCLSGADEGRRDDGWVSKGATRAAPVPQVKKQPQPVPQLQPQPQPPVGMDHAISTVDRMNADDRRVFIEKLSSRFPSEVEALHAYDDKMALKRPATVMKPLAMKKG